MSRLRRVLKMWRPTRSVRRRPRWVAFLVLSFVVGWAGACATPPPAFDRAPVETGFLMLWEATSPTGEPLHLLGTIHVGRTQEAFDPAIADALEAADVLALELDLTALDPQHAASVMARRGFLGGAPAATVFDEVGPDTAALLRRWLALEGLPDAAVAALKPWALWLMIVSASFEDAGVGSAAGTEAQLAEQSTSRQRVVGLETLDDQIDAIESLSPERIEHLLAISAEDAIATASAGNDEPAAPAPDSVASAIDGMLDAWQKGDLDWIESLTRDGDTQDLSTILIDARNHQMVDAIEALLTAGHRPFVAVGTAHMTGVAALPALLAERGYRVRRIPKTSEEGM